MLPTTFDALAASAAQLYRAAGHTPYYFARSKLATDPVFPALLRDGLLNGRDRVLDLGCGQGLLLALAVAARRTFEDGQWIDQWPAPPIVQVLRGVDLQPSAVRAAQLALGSKAHFAVADLRNYRVPQSDAIVLLDVLHYLERPDQTEVLRRCSAALPAGGLLILRVGDADAGWRVWATKLVDGMMVMIRRGATPRLHMRPLTDWIASVEAAGFDVAERPMSAGTPFANVLLTCVRK